MIFNSFQFIWSFPIIFCLYHLINGSFKRYYSKIGNNLLLIISYLLYMNWIPAYSILLLGITAVTFLSAIAIERFSNKKKVIINTGVLLTLLPLLIFKYYNFLNHSITELLNYYGLNFELTGLNLIVPVGISFYTFQALGYLWDVYYGKIKAEKNWWDYMLFVSFFPQIASGPISKASDLLPQIKAEREFNYSQAVEGLKFLLWGMFLKVVLADRLGLYVDSVYSNYQYHNGLTCLTASVMYSFQIYGDFAGYSCMAVGVGKLLGFDLINNFKRPYLAVSVTDFWRRWHISLSTWLKDYIYIPLGGSRCSKLRNYWNIFVTFLVSGIWHGANWTFIVWGILHGLFQIIEKACNLQKNNTGGGILRIIITFILINFAWIFFRMPDVESAFEIINKIFTFQNNLDLYLPNNDIVLYSIVALIFTISKDIIDEYSPNFLSSFFNNHICVRYFLYLVLLLLIIAIGVLDSSNFIYFQF